MQDRPAMDITNAAVQDAIAESLLGDEREQAAQPGQEQSEYAVSGDELLNEAIAEQESNAFRHGDEGLTHRLEEQPEAEAQQPQERLRSERAPEEQQVQRQPEAQEQQQAPTLEAIQQHFDSLDKAIQDHGLTDAPTMKGFVDELATAVGANVANNGWNVEHLGGSASQVALEALRLGESVQWDVGKINSMPEDAANILGHKIAVGIGLNPQIHDVNKNELANAFLAGAVNFYSTVAKYGGRVTDPAMLNDPQACMYFMGRVLRSLGYEGPINRDAAVGAANAFAKYLLSFSGRVYSANQRAAEAQRASQQKQPRARGQRVPSAYRDGIRGSKVPKFASNQDIFSGAAVEAAMSQKL